jgi:hypothetical protein
MTSREHIGKRRLEEALREYDVTFYDAFAPSGEKIVYSKEFLCNMERIIGRAKVKKRPFVGVFIRHAAAVLLAVGIAFCGMLGVSSVKRPFTEFMIHVYEAFNEVFFGEKEVAKAPSTIETVYALQNVPSGYGLTEKHITEYEVKFFWTSGDGEKIVFTQMLLDTKSTLDNETADFDIIYIDNGRYAVVRKDGKQAFYWNDNHYAYSLIVPSALSEQDCMALVTSIGVYEGYSEE